MTDPIRISAIIPTYNREKTVVRAIESMLSQEYPPAEILIIDDGSQDNTRSIVKTYGEKIRYIYQDNSGVASARNKGVAAAQFEWIAFLDSDDYWLPHHLKRACEVIKKTKGEASLYFSDLLKPDAMGCRSHWECCGFSISGDYELKCDASEWALLRTQPMMIPTSVIKRACYLSMGGIPQSLVTREDTFLFHVLCLLYPACAISGCGAVISSDGNQSVRLTARFDGYSSTFHECTKLLCRELLRFSDRMHPVYRLNIENGLVAAYIHFGRVLMKRKRFLTAMANILGGFKISPVVAARILIGILNSYYSKNVQGK